jgi:hypothetical protein
MPDLAEMTDAAFAKGGPIAWLLMVDGMPARSRG